MRRLTTLFCILTCFILGFAQQYAFREISLKKGLPQSQVKAINQDDDGFLWIGTLGGLARFDGHTFETYTIEHGLLNNRITFIEFIDGILYAGHDNGISIMSSLGKFTPISNKKYTETGRFTHLVKFQKKLLLASNAHGLFELNKNTITPVYPTINSDTERDEFQRIRKMTVFDNKIYFATRGGLFYSSDLKNYHLLEGTEEWSSSDVKTLENGILLTNYNEGTYHITFNKNRATSFNKILDQPSAECRIQEAAQNKTKQIWTLTEEKKIVRQDIGFSISEKLHSIDLELNQSSGLPSEALTTLFVDQAGVLWLGTEGKGLFQFLGEAFVKYKLEAPVLTALKDASGKLWFGTFNGGLVTLKNLNHKVEIPKSLKENSVWCSLKDKDNNLWFGTNNGLYIWNGNRWLTWTKENQDLLPDNKISALYEDQQNNVWIGTKKGVAKVRKLEFVPLNISRSENLQVVRDIIGFQGDLIIATKTDLYRLDLESLKLALIDLKGMAPSFSCLYVDQENALWIGSEEGLFVFTNNQFHSINYATNSAEKFINFVIKLNDQVLVGTNNGIFAFSNYNHDLSKYQLKHYDEALGLTSTETNLKSAFNEPVAFGKMWFGTSDGLFLFKPKKLNPELESYAPKIYPSKFEVNFSDYKIPPQNQEIFLKYNQNRLRFVFQILDLYQHDKLTLEYRLGNQESWSTAGSASEIVFNQLASGQYLLQVRAKNSNGNFSEILNFQFTISQPFYASWWFITLLLLAVLLIILGAVQYHIRQIKTQQKQERLELSNRLNALEQQSLNASMNRHFIFNALNSIQYFINTQDKLSANKYLSKFAQLIRKNLDSSAAGENQVALSEEIQRLQLYLSLESMRFQDRFDYVFDIDLNIDLEYVKIPPMLFQPFIENAIIHGILPNESLAGKISFSAKKLNEEIVFKITDNGVGYSTTIKQKKSKGDHFSHGTSITKSRIEVIRKISGDIISMDGPEDIILQDGSIGGTQVVIRLKPKKF